MPDFFSLRSYIAVLSLAFTISSGVAQTPSADKAGDVQLSGEAFPLLKLAECDRQGSVYQSANLDINIRGSVLWIQGHDQTGNAWSMRARFSGPGCEIFQGNLSGTGRRDIVALIPGIGSRGAYDNRLLVLLFDADGKPFPWSALGLFTPTSHGIQQIHRSPGGQALVLHNYLVGHPAWGGVSHVSKLYEVSDSRMESIEGPFSGLTFPIISGAKRGDPAFERQIIQSSLSTAGAAGANGKTTAAALPHVLRYGPDAAPATSSRTTTPLTATQAANPMVDVNAFNAATDHLILSDGSRIEIPTILMIDSLSGARAINFAPEGSDMARLAKRPYAVQLLGKDCSEPDDCHPLILRAIEQNP